MKQILTLIAATFIFTAVNAGALSSETPINTTAERSVLNVTLQAAGKVSITWSAVAGETTTTAYEIQKRTNGGEFKTVAILMGDTLPSYSFRDKVNIAGGNIEYRIVTTDKNVVVKTVSQNLVIL
jgi:hypothetical protein